MLISTGKREKSKIRIHPHECMSSHRGDVPNVRQFCNRILNIAACLQTRSLIAIKVFQFVPLELGNPETTWLSNCVARAAPDPGIFERGGSLLAVIYSITNFLFSNEII